MSVRSTMEPKPVMHDAWDDDIDDIALSEEALASSMRDRELMRSVMGKYRNPYLVGNLIKLELEEIELEMDKRFDAVVMSNTWSTCDITCPKVDCPLPFW